MENIENMTNEVKDEHSAYNEYRAEYSQARLERIINRLIWVIIILIILLVGSNAWWVHYENQFQDTVTVSQEVETESSPAYVNGTGSMTVNGEDKTNNN